MSNPKQQLTEALRATLGETADSVSLAFDEVSVEVSADNLLDVATRLRDEEKFQFQQLVDLCGVDYSQFGRDEWQTDDASRGGFSRGVADGVSSGRLQFGDELESLLRDRMAQADAGRFVDSTPESVIARADAGPR